MHSFQSQDGNSTFHFDGGFDGDIQICKNIGNEIVSETRISMANMDEFISFRITSEIEEMEPEERLLWLSQFLGTELTPTQ